MPPKPRTVDPALAVADAQKKVSAAGDDVEDVLRHLERDFADAVTRRHNELKPMLDALATAEAELREAVESHPDLFVKPRSRTAAGVRVQRRKAPDDWDFDPDVTAQLIAEHRQDLASAVSTKTVIDRKKLDALTPAQLKKIGVQRTRGSESTSIKRLRDDLDQRLAQLRPWLS